jgi:predicted RNase H-like HicB family nuclease
MPSGGSRRRFSHEEDHSRPDFEGEKQYIAECFDLLVVTQGKTLDEVTENLREAISLQLRGENLADFDLAEEPSVLASFELEPLLHAQP